MDFGINKDGSFNSIFGKPLSKDKKKFKVKKCCENCRYLNNASDDIYYPTCDHVLICFFNEHPLLEDGGWKIEKDYCSRFELKEEVKE
jgi:hypothetical protein